MKRRKTSSLVRCAALFVSTIWMLSAGRAQSTATLSFGEASGSPGEIVRVPVTASYTETLQSFIAPFVFDATQLRFVTFSVEGTAAASVDRRLMIFRTFDPGDGIVGFGTAGGDLAQKAEIPPGDEVVLGEMVLQIRARAEVGEATIEMPEQALNTAATAHVGFVGGSDAELTRVDGKVTVLAPDGPRPVADLSCRQIVDRIELSFEPTEEYDAIELRHAGQVVQTLVGDATSAVFELEGRVGAQVFGVVAQRGDDASVEVTCEVLATSPTAPAVSQFECSDDGQLSWVNPVVFDSLTLLKDDDVLAELDGDVESFHDANLGNAIAVYTIQGVLEGFTGAPATCIANGIWTLEIGDVRIEPGTRRVRLPLFATVPFPARGISVVFDVDRTRMTFVEDTDAAVEGTVGWQDPEWLAIGVSPPDGFYSTAVIWDIVPPNNPERDLQVGVRQHFLNYTLELDDSFQEGDVIPVRIAENNINGFTIDPTRIRQDSESVRPDVTIDGRIFVGDPGVARVANLQAVVESRGGVKGVAGPPPGKDVILTWRNTDAYDALLVERNGETIATLPGDATQFVDVGAPRGVHTYKVIGQRGEATSFPSRRLASTVSVAGAFLRGDANGDLDLDISDPILALQFLFLGEAVDCEDAVDADDNGALEVTDPIVVLEFLFLGGRPITAPSGEVPWIDPTRDELGCARGRSN